MIEEAWLVGVSSRRADDLVQPIGMTGISKSSGSKLCKDIDERVHASLKRPLAGDWHHPRLDAVYLKVRQGDGIFPTRTASSTSSAPSCSIRAATTNSSSAKYGSRSWQHSTYQPSKRRSRYRLHQRPPENATQWPYPNLYHIERHNQSGPTRVGNPLLYLAPVH